MTHRSGLCNTGPGTRNTEQLNFHGHRHTTQSRGRPDAWQSLADVNRHLPEIQYELNSGIPMVPHIWQIKRACHLTDGNQ